MSLLLAESQVLVKLAPDLQLRCEVLTRDGRDGDLVVSGPELEFGVGVQFRFK